MFSLMHVKGKELLIFSSLVYDGEFIKQGKKTVHV